MNIFLFFIFFNLHLLAYSSSLSELSFPKKEIAVVQISFDGVNSLHCGVGTVVQETQQVLQDLNEKYKGTIHFKLYLISADYSQNLPEYSKDLLENNKKTSTESGGKVFLIPTDYSNELFGHIDQWKDLCKKGAEICAEIINTNEHTIILAHDTPYAHIPIEIGELALQGVIENPYQAIWIPHATGWSYNGHSENGIPNYPERHAWEMEACVRSNSLEYKVGYISPTIYQDLISFPFSVPKESLQPYQTGIFLDRYLVNLSEEVIRSELIKRNIPTDKRLIFSIGRANPLKGQDIVLEMYRHLIKSNSDIHLVLLAPFSDGYQHEYLLNLKKRIAEEKLDVTLIDFFDTNLAQLMYQWPKTAIVALLSRTDTQPLTVMEARANPKNSVVLVSDSSRSGLQVVDMVDGFCCSLDGISDLPIESPQPLEGALKNIVIKAQAILNMPDICKKKVIESGKEKVLKKYNLRTNIENNLYELLETSTKHSPPPKTNPLLILKQNALAISDLYELPYPLEFEELVGGLANPPILVSYIKNDEKKPLGVIKKELKNLAQSAVRLKTIHEISKTFLHLPLVYMNKKGGYLTEIGPFTYYFIEYLEKKDKNLSLEAILEITGKFHKQAALIPSKKILKTSKLEEYLKRKDLFFCDNLYDLIPEIIQDPFWDQIIEWVVFFSSPQFKTSYEKLPFQIIHGDNNQTNMLASKKRKLPYIIDLDSIRFDIRLIDLASYFRYGGFDDYINLSKTGKLIDTINHFYGKQCSNLSKLEEDFCHQIVIFSHIEFMSWALEMLHEHRFDPLKRDQFISYLKIYTEQLKRINKTLNKK